MNCIEVKNVTKYFGKLCTLDNVSLQFEENKIYGLLGRNGAGKSTLFNIISNRIFATSGKVLLDGENIINNDDTSGKIFLMNDKNQYSNTMKIKTIFKWMKAFYPDFDEDYANQLSKDFSLDTNKYVKSLSTGYISIFNLILALSVNTPYLLLDEPVLGLDANHRDMFYRILLQKYSEKPCTIIISTHLIDEISSLLENIIIIDQGIIMKIESLEQLLSQYYTISGNASSIDTYLKDKQVLGTETLGGLKTAYVLGPVDQKVPYNLAVSTLDLQKLFIQLTNKEEGLR